MGLYLVIILIVVLCLGIWINGFCQLMLLGDADFPGRYDKLVWGLAFIFLFPIAPFAFMFWKLASATLTDDEPEPVHPAYHDEPQQSGFR